MLTKIELAEISKVSWRPLGQGSYNQVQVSERRIPIQSRNSYWVRKLPYGAHPGSLNETSRAERKWQEINPDIPFYKLSEEEWMVPYLGHQKPSDAEVAAQVIKIYRSSRNIVLDAPSSGNFLKTPNGEVVCVDVDQAVRCDSPTSDQYYLANEDLQSHANFFDKSVGYDLTIKIIRALRYLERHLRKEHIRNEYIRQDILCKLHVFQQHSEPITEQTLRMLLVIANVDPGNDIPNTLLDNGLINELAEMQAQGQPITKQLILSLTDIHYNIIHGRFDRVRALLQRNPHLKEQRDSYGFSPIHTAAVWGQFAIAKFLVSEGAAFNLPSPNAQTALTLALLNHHDEIALFLYEIGAIVYPYFPGQHHLIHVVATLNKPQFIENLLRCAPYLVNVPNDRNYTPLALAAAAGHDNVVRCLLARGANINYRHSIHSIKLEDSYTAFDWAFLNGRTSTIRLLCESGAKATFVYSTYKGKTLHELIQKNALDDVKVLLGQNKELIKQVDENGRTPLALARSLGLFAIEHYLRFEEMAIDFSTIDITPKPKVELPCTSSPEQKARGCKAIFFQPFRQSLAGSLQPIQSVALR